MKKLLFLLLLANSANAAPPPPGPVASGVQEQFNLRLFLTHDVWTIYSEIMGTVQTEGRVRKDFTLGGYYQLFDQLKVGAFYRRSYGIRHDEDWVTNGTWGWRETNSRGEDFWILDATPRIGLDTIGMNNFVAELKTRFINNTYNHNQMVFVRPGLTYFWLKEDQPFINIFLQYEMQFALNYGPQVLNERWLYFGALYKACPNFDIGIYNALMWENWGSYGDYTRRGGPAYNISTQTYVVGLVGIFNFGI